MADPIPPGVAIQRADPREAVMSDMARQLEEFGARRSVLKHFIRQHLVEAEYDAKGFIKAGGRLGDYYRVRPGSETRALTATGADKVAQLARLFQGKRVSKQLEVTREFVMATVCVEILSFDGRVVGAGEAAASTAEPGFQKQAKKYGAKVDKEGNILQDADWRAAVNDVLAKAGKRAWVQGVTVTLAIREIFDEITADAQAVPEYPDEWRDRQGRKARVPSGPYAGRPLAELPRRTLEAYAARLRDMPGEGWDDLLEVILEHLEEGRFTNPGGGGE